jgi:integrase
MKNIYLRGNNWYADFTFHGKRQRFMIGPSRKGAEAVIAKKKAEIAEGKFLDVQKQLKPIEFHAFAVEYLAWAKANKKPLSVKQNIYQLRKLEEEFGGKNLHELTMWTIEKYKSKRKEKVGPSAINGEIRLLKHFFNKAVEWRKVKDNPAKKIKLLKGEKQRTRFLSQEEAQRLLMCSTEPLRSIAAVALNTGMRKSEIFSLKWPEVNFDQKLITILDSKNHEIRKIPINETAQRVLKEIPRYGEFVFSHKGGKPYTSVQKAFNHAKQKAGIEGFVFHSLRHTFASWLVMLGVDLTTVMQLLGHKSLAMTTKYAHLSPAHKTKAINLLDNVSSSRMAQETVLAPTLGNVVSISR